MQTHMLPYGRRWRRMQRLRQPMIHTLDTDSFLNCGLVTVLDIRFRISLNFASAFHVNL